MKSRPTITPDVAAVGEESVSQTRAHLDVAAAATATLYPLTSFVASNPLSGVEGLGFTAASAVASEVAGAVEGPSAASLRAAMSRGDVRWTDVECALDDVWGAHTSQPIPGWSRGRLRDAVASMVLDDDVDASRLAQAERALHLAGVPVSREVLTPLEALGDRSSMPAHARSATTCARGRSQGRDGRVQPIPGMSCVPTVRAWTRSYRYGERANG